MPIFRKLDSVGRTVALVFGGQWLILQAIIWAGEGRDFPEYFWLGNDYSFLHSAAGYFLSGHSPYREANFVPLPPALYLPLALHHLSMWSALTAFRTISFFLVIAAILWLGRELRLTAMNRALMVVIAVTYGPFYTVLAGGNLDALMLAFMVFACARSAPVRGAFLGLSVGTKFYSVLLIPVLALRRRWRELIWALAVFIVLLLPFVRYMPDALWSISHRTSVLRLDSNESPAVLFILIFGANRVWVWRACYLLLWGGTLVVRLAADARSKSDLESERFNALDYLPWMAAAPVLVFTYTGTILLAVMVCLIRKNQDRSLNWAEWTSVAGFLLTGFYPALYGRTFSYLAGASAIQVKNLSMAIAPLGISAMLVGGSVAAWKALKDPRVGAA